MYYWNNFVEGGLGGSAYCLRAGHEGVTIQNLVFENNLCVTSVGSSTQGVATAGAGSGLSATTKTIEHNVVLTPSKASSDGYTSGSTHAYSPQSGTAPTIAAGDNLTGQGSGALGAMCWDTSYAGARSPTPRPNGASDVGAFQWQ